MEKLLGSANHELVGTGVNQAKMPGGEQATFIEPEKIVNVLVSEFQGEMVCRCSSIAREALAFGVHNGLLSLESYGVSETASC